MLLLQLQNTGSSPRMRGTPRFARQERGLPGIIPAYAGNTLSRPCGVVPVRDHPRVCGEHRRYKRHAVTFSGSSPRMRGTRYSEVTARGISGIIPAYAGNTVGRCRVRWIRWDHPRVCGEHPSGPHELAWITGSSPRMRGTLLESSQLLYIERIIPAYAGNTPNANISALSIWDHPRVCGEHKPTTKRSARIRGSSPRMRGTPDRLAEDFRYDGIIPAYAGNTSGGRSSRPSSRDHPRVCGEHRDVTHPECFGRGSSPRMRGTH